MIEEIPTWACLRAEGLIPRKHGSMCLRALISDLNMQGTESVNAATDSQLRFHAMSIGAAASHLACPVGPCDAKTPMTPELNQLLSERSL